MLSYIYSTHPNAPALTQDDKTRMVAAYFRILSKYTLQDVLSAVDIYCREKHSFIPTPYEIESKVCRTLDVEQYLPQKYWDLDKELYQYKATNLYALQSEIRSKYRLTQDEIEREKLKAEFEECEKRKVINIKLAEMYREAEIKAIEAYEALCANHAGISEIAFESFKKIERK